MANKVNRRKSRAIAMEMIYSGTVNERDFDITDEFLEDFSSITETIETLDKKYIREVVELAEAREGHFRSVITPYLKDWDIHRISRVNLAILRISVAELLYLEDIPPRVSVNEAIELTKTYSDDESTAFINGVLDKVLKARQEGLIPEWSPEMEIEIAEEKSEAGEVIEDPLNGATEGSMSESSVDNHSEEIASEDILSTNSISDDDDAAEETVDDSLLEPAVEPDEHLVEEELLIEEELEAVHNTETEPVDS